MPRRRDEQPRVLGPYWLEAKGYWKVTTVDPGADAGAGRRVDRYFGSIEEATAWKKMNEQRFGRLTGRTVREALDEYEEHLTERAIKETSRTETMRRIRLFFELVKDTKLARLKPERAKQIYASFREGRSVDYHRNALGNAKTFAAWCVEQGLLPLNPLDGVKGEGQRSTGKDQLTGDEARKFHLTALRMADQGDLGALAADMLLLMGLRQSEVWKRCVRDLDLDGTVLRIENGKTRKSNRIVGIPEVLRSRLLEVVEDRGPRDVLFPTGDDGEHTRAWLYFAVRRVCDAAKVPRVCPHGLRGTWATLAMRVGQASQAVADALGHEDVRTTMRHYAQPEAMADAQQDRALAVIQGGRR